MVIAVIIIVLLAAGALLGLWAAFYKTFYSPHKGQSETEGSAAVSNHPYHEEARELVKKLAATECERFRISSYDGLRLSARYYAGREGEPLCILFHGYRGSALRDFAYIENYLLDNGYSVLAVDERAHWRSQGHTISFGIRERFDVVSWVNFVSRRFGADTPIYLFGISMGGGTVLMASGQELPANVKGIVADCPFNSAMDIILHVCEQMKLNPTLCRPIIKLCARLYGHFDPDETTAADEVKKTKTPILIIHGEGDDFVPAYMSREVKDANPDMVEYVTVPEAGHGLSSFYDRELYVKTLRKFMGKSEDKEEITEI